MLGSLKSLAHACLITLFAALPASCNGVFHRWIENVPASQAQTPPSWLAMATDPLWQRVSMILSNDARARFERIHGELRAEMRAHPELGEIDEDPETTASIEGEYGRLPEVRVDTGQGAIFPEPLEPPRRFSWFQAAVEAQALERATRKFDAEYASWKSLSSRDARTKRFQDLVTDFYRMQSALVTLTRDVRYLESWVPQYQKRWMQEKAIGKLSISYLVAQAIREQDHDLMSSLRRALRPRRRLHRPFLPEILGVKKWIVLPIATDITDKKFLREFEGALDTHWNQSPWAHEVNTRFKIRWIPVPRDSDFAAKKITLAQHLARFPRNALSLTTGGLTTYVRGQTLVLGPSNTNPRTLAHEIGHLLGFTDCYLRTLSGQGIFGLGILEWDNPIYPDDLMCDNTIGVARSEVW